MKYKEGDTISSLDIDTVDCNMSHLEVTLKDGNQYSVEMEWTGTKFRFTIKSLLNGDKRQTDILC